MMNIDVYGGLAPVSALEFSRRAKPGRTSAGGLDGTP